MSTTAKAPNSRSELLLGWHLDNELHPIYWKDPGAKPGKHAPEHVLSIQADRIAKHIAIVAQSGSGKSFFLGRLIEEILIKTRARIIIIDPNSDFRKIAMTNSNVWKKAGYKDGKGFVPEDHSDTIFKDGWDKVDMAVFSAARQDSSESKRLKIERLEIDWTGISTDVLAGDLNPLMESELRRCHDFVRTISLLISLTKPEDWTSSHHLIDESQRLFEATKGKSEADVLEELARAFAYTPSEEKKRSRIKSETRRLDTLCRQAANHRIFVADEIGKFYFSNAHDIKSSKLINASNKRRSKLVQRRLQVIDLPSIRRYRFQSWIVSTILTTEAQEARERWEQAISGNKDDVRVPTFIVIDEAHNLIPAEPDDHSQKGLREQFRRIAAEGRKFGLFLIVVSQRPDKLDPFIVSECENRVVMKLSSPSVLQTANKLLGLSNVPKAMLDKCLDFGTGRALIAGTWVDEPVIVYGATRRTEEGGRNLDPAHWARPEQSSNADSGSAGPPAGSLASAGPARPSPPITGTSMSP